MRKRRIAFYAKKEYLHLACGPTPPNPHPAMNRHPRKTAARLIATAVAGLAMLFAAAAPSAAAPADKRKQEAAMPRNDLRNDRYRVRIATDGATRRIEVHGALVSDIAQREANNADTTGAARTLMGFAMFTDDFSSPVTVRVKRRGRPFDSVEVRPSAYAIPCRRISPRKVEFTLDKPTQKVSVEFDGDRARNLFVVPDLPDTAARRAPSPDTIYFGRGEHHAGLIELRSGQTLYIDEGATVYGTVRSYDTHNIAIAGRGILCGSRAPHHLDTRRVMVDLVGCRNVSISGIMLRDSPSWTLCIQRSENVRIDNVKQICWMRNSDGVDLCNCRDVVMENCFMRNYDDNISLKNEPWNTGDTRGITIRRCVLWADCAHNFLVGPESDPRFRTDNVEFADCILLEGRETLYPYKGAMAMMISDEGRFSDIRIRRITIERPRGASLFSFDYCKFNSRGREARNIVVEDVVYTGTTPPRSLLHGMDALHPIDGITFRNITINGVRLTRQNFGDYFDMNEHVRRLNVE